MRAIYDYVAINGVPAPGGGLAVPAGELSGLLHDDGAGFQATRIMIQVGSFVDRDIIEPVWEQLEDSAASMESAAPGLEADVSGDVITHSSSRWRPSPIRCWWRCRWPCC
ncbi:MAG: hypothetical protein GWO04_15085 [Actinobacteria bacterium]|nr:hypothetical protein [Actinomycetota bacterium]